MDAENRSLSRHHPSGSTRVDVRSRLHRIRAVRQALCRRVRVVPVSWSRLHWGVDRSTPETGSRRLHLMVWKFEMGYGADRGGVMIAATSRPVANRLSIR